MHEISSRIIAESNILIQEVSALASSVSLTPSKLTLNENVYNWILNLYLHRYYQIYASNPFFTSSKSSYLPTPPPTNILTNGLPWRYYTPIAIEPLSRNEMRIDFCQLKVQEYFYKPHLYPMFKSLVTASECTIKGQGKFIQRKLSEVYSEIIEAQKNHQINGRILYPTAFIFHESRVGSTLLANILSKDPFNLVYSESSPPVSAVFCGSCTEKTAISRLIHIITLMGRSPYHQRLFFKFQSIMTTKMHIVLQVLVSRMTLSLFDDIYKGLSRCSMDISIS